MAETVIPEGTQRRAPRQEKVIEALQEAGVPLQPKQISKLTDLESGNVRTGVRQMLDEALYQPAYGLYDLVERLQLHVVQVLESAEGPIDFRQVVDEVTQRVEGADPDYIHDVLSDFSFNFFEQHNSDYQGQTSDGLFRNEDVPQMTLPPPQEVSETDEASPPTMRYVPLVGVNANGGNGEVPFDVRVERQVAYDTRQLHSSGIDASRAVLIRVTGDSMKPTLAPGDGLLVERYAGEPLRDGTIYVLRQRDYGVVVKRLYWTDDKTLELRSDNPDGPTLTMDPENEDDWDVIGRVARVEKAL